MSWRRIRLLIWKEFAQLRRDPAFFRIMFIAPIIMVLIFGYVVGSDIKNLDLAVLDNDHSVQSRRVVDAFTSTGYFTVSARPDNEAELKEVMDGGRAVIAIDIPAGFGDAIRARQSSRIGIVIDGSDSRASSVANGYASGIISNLSAEFYPQTATLASAGGVDSQVRVLYNPTLRSINAMIPALLAFILLMSTSNVMSQAIVKERERGTLEQLFVTPIGRTDYLLGKLLPYVGIAALQVVVVFLFGTLWFRVPFNGSLWVIGIGLMLFMLSALGLGMLVSLISTTRQQAQQSAQFLQMPQMMLSGFMFPIEAFPTWLYYVTYLIPLRYILEILRSNFMKGSSFSQLWFPFVAMAVFSIAIFVLGLSRFHKRLAD